MMKVVQINKHDLVGGAAQIAFSLHKELIHRQHYSIMMVGSKHFPDQSVLQVENDRARSRWTRYWLEKYSGCLSGKRLLKKIAGGLAKIGEPARWMERYWGLDDYHCPGWHQDDTRKMLADADILHFHNLHNDYFDLRIIPDLTCKMPAVITLHDEWSYTGHCGYTIDCERWQFGCGNCPDLDRPPAVRRDATAKNYLRKKSIYQESKLYITAPSRWLLDRARGSILQHAAVGWKVIPNGVDLEVFQPGNRVETRRRLGLPEEAFICLFVGVGTRSNPYKDYQTMRAAVEISAQSAGEQQITFLAVGEEGPDEAVGQCRILHVGSIADRTEMADYYRAADVYLHAARSENFPTTILEAMACGTPVVAAAVGGIPEQIEDGVTGFLVPEGDAEAMANRINILAENEPFRATAGTIAVEKARDEFDLKLMASRYLDLYKELLESYPSDDGNKPVGMSDKIKIHTASM